MKNWFIYIIIICFSFQSYTQQSFILELEKDEISLGGQTKLHVILSYPSKLGQLDSGFIYLPLDTLTSAVEIVDTSKLKAKAVESVDLTFTKTLEQTLTITSFDSGVHVIPGLQVKIGNTLIQSNEVEISVKGYAVNTEEDIKDIKDVYSEKVTVLEHSYLWIRRNWVFILPILLLLIGGYLFYRYMKKSKKDLSIIKETVYVPIHLQFLKKLEQIDAQKLWQNGQLKDYHTSITAVIRGYIAKRYNVNALEQTTDEILKSLRFSAINAQQQETMRELLMLADLVKFAKEEPTPAENERIMTIAREFIEGTKLLESPTAHSSSKL